MKDCPTVAKWQIDLSSAVQDLLAVAIQMDVKNWAKAREHLARSQAVCGRLLEALEDEENLPK